MSSKIENTGTYRGVAIDHAVTESSGGYPQLVLQLCATEYYDDETGEYIDVSDQGLEIYAYLVLFGGDGKATLNCSQVQKVFSWDGKSFTGLNELDISEMGLQFRVEENNYEGKTTNQVNWVDEFDAIPGRSMKKLDAKGIKELDAKFNAALKQLGGAKAPAKPKSAPAIPPKAAVTKKATTKKAETAPPTAPPKAPSANVPSEAKTCTKDEAWADCYEIKSARVSEDELIKVWGTAIRDVGEGILEADLTPEQWAEVREKVQGETGVV